MTECSFVINFHGIGVPLRPIDRGEEPYWLGPALFNKVLDFVGNKGPNGGIRLTFDDGNTSDFTVAAQALSDRKLTADFFVLAGKIGQAGYLSKYQIRALFAQGFEIGSHGLDHVLWTAASEVVLGRELGDSKRILEDIIGAPVKSAAVPFGRYDRRVLELLIENGYKVIFSSDGGPRLTNAPPIPRYTIKRGIDLPALITRIRSTSTLRARTTTEARVLLRSWLLSIAGGLSS